METLYTVPRSPRLGRLCFAAFAVFAICVLAAAPARAQFVSGSNGSDGSITFALPLGQTSFTFDFNPTTICQQSGVTCSLGSAPGIQLDTDGDNIYHFGTVTINSNVNVRLRASQLRHTGPVVWLATGDVTINGFVDLRGTDGHVGGQTVSVRGPSEPGAGGFPGGAGAKPGDVAERGAGPGGAVIANNATHGCPAGNVVAGLGDSAQIARCASGGAAYGTTLIQPLIGGSGGSGGHYSGTNQGSGGGAGGGAIRISSSGTIRIGGTGIWAYGGANGGANGGYIGGAGSGGAIHLQARTVTQLVVCGGSCGLYAGGRAIGIGGGFGTETSSDGRIRIDADSWIQNNGIVAPTPVVGPTVSVPLPTGIATVKVLSIGGVSVPANPVNQYTVPDLSIDSLAPVVMQVQTTNIPVGTVLKLYVTSEGAGVASADQVVNSTPLAGTLASSTASANITLPQGVSRLFVRATW